MLARLLAIAAVASLVSCATSEDPPLDSAAAGDALSGDAATADGGPDATPSDTTPSDTTTPDTAALPDTTADAAPVPDADADATGDSADADGPPCTYAGAYLLPGPCEPGFDAELAAKARRYDRVWRALNAEATGVNTDVTVALDHPQDRALIEAFAAAEGWDFAAFAEKDALTTITHHGKVAGLYAGVGIAADAFRYGVLRDQGAEPAEVDIARAHLLTGLDGLHRAVAITGVPGVIARGYQRTDLPGAEGIVTTPLFDELGAPLPLEKNNGTWREDGSGELPGWVWEDSISRDQMLGWVTAFAGAWEVIRDDATVKAAVKDRLQADALAIGRELMVVRESGYDLEIPDADGRTTLHGYLNENAIEGTYLGQPINGFHALMALGFVSGWVYVTDDPELRAYLHDDLIGARKLPELARDMVIAAWAGNKTNYSNTNMAFGSIWLAQRYLDHEAAQAVLAVTLESSLYAIPDQPDQPAVLGQTYFDFIYAAGMAGQRADAKLTGPIDSAAMERGVQTLREFPDAPYWNVRVESCPGATCTCEEPEVEPACTAPDGTEMTLLGCVGRSCDLIADDPVPMRIRPPSNYHWRSSPFKPNGDGDGSALLPGVDFRIAYWTARWVAAHGN